MRSGHYNHRAHAQQQAEFFARVEAERRAMQREREPGQAGFDAGYQAATNEAAQMAKEGVWR